MFLPMVGYRSHARATGGHCFELYVTPETAACGCCGRQSRRSCSILYARTSTGEVQVLLWSWYEHRMNGTAVILEGNMLIFWVGDKKHGACLVVGFLGRLEIFAGF